MTEYEARVFRNLRVFPATVLAFRLDSGLHLEMVQSDRHQAQEDGKPTGPIVQTLTFRVVDGPTESSVPVPTPLPAKPIRGQVDIDETPEEAKAKEVAALTGS